MPGILTLDLNGQPVLPVSPGRSEYEILLDVRAERHQLVLVVDTTESSDPSSAARDWGHVSLVIRAEELIDSSQSTTGKPVSTTDSQPAE